MANFLSKIFNEDARKIKQIEKRIQPVLDKEEEYKKHIIAIYKVLQTLKTINNIS